MKNRAEKLFCLFSWASAVTAVSAFGLFLGFLIKRGLSTIQLSLFFGNISPWDGITGKVPVWDGIWPACIGTIYLVCISSVIAIPFGISSGIYLSEYTSGRVKSLLSYAVDLLSGIPSIVMGLFGFVLILFLRHTFMPRANTCLFLSSLCIALLILPYLIRTTETALGGLPDSLKLVGISLGFSKWQNISHVLLPAAGRGILSGVILAIGRAAEDTAVILLTGVVANAGLPQGLTDKFEALPFNIYFLAAEYRTPLELDRGFGSALVLLVITGSLFVGAYLLQRKLEKRWYSKIEMH